jgi:hypothetical protein
VERHHEGAARLLLHPGDPRLGEIEVLCPPAPEILVPLLLGKGLGLRGVVLSFLIGSRPCFVGSVFSRPASIGSPITMRR